MSSFCAGCGTGLAEGEIICGNCGHDPSAPAVAPVDPAVAFGLPPENSGKAIFSLVCCLLFFFPPSSIVAVVFGHLSLSDIRKGHGRLKGRGMAITSLIFGYLELAAWIVFFVAVAWTIPNTLKTMQSVNANQRSTVSAMRTLNTAEIAYAQSHREAGYTCSLPELSKSWGMSPDLAQGQTNGYTFQVQGCSSLQPNGPITKYQILAYPVTTGKRLPVYCSTESAVIKVARSGSAQDCLSKGRDVPTLEVNR